MRGHEPMGEEPELSNRYAIFIPKFNSAELNPKSKKVADAKTFSRGAKLYSSAFNVSSDRTFVIDNSRPFRARASMLLKIMERERETVDFWTFFCHGFSLGIQLGIRWSTDDYWVDEDRARFVKALSYRGETNPFGPIVCLFACSTGQDITDTTAPGTGDGSFADSLRDSLCKEGATRCRVLSHYTEGHSWHNPNVRIFDGLGFSEGGEGGDKVVVGESAKQAFKRLLKRDRSSKMYGRGLAWEMGRMDVSDIRKRISTEMEWGSA